MQISIARNPLTIWPLSSANKSLWHIQNARVRGGCQVQIKNVFMMWSLFVIKNIGQARRKELRVIVKAAANKIPRGECIDFLVAKNGNAIHVSCV